jgi:hypothetical protein
MSCSEYQTTVNCSSTGVEHNVVASTAVDDIKYCANRDIDDDDPMIDIASDEYCTAMNDRRSIDRIDEHEPANYNSFISGINVRTGINPIHAAANYVDHGELCDLQQKLHYDIKDVAAAANYNGPRSLGCDHISNINSAAPLHDNQVYQFPLPSNSDTCKYNSFDHLIQYRSHHHQQLVQPENADDFNINPIFCGQIRHTSSVLMNYTASASGSNCTISNNISNVVNQPCRVCAHCKTRKTPLWRNGPLGPKVKI